MGSTGGTDYGAYTYENLEREPYWPSEKLRISITGAGGFIASHIARRLKSEGHYIVASDWKKNEHMTEDMFCHEFHLVDLRVMDNCLKVTKDVDHVFNLAADMGGPINKTCTVFLYLMADAGRYEFFAFLAAGACIPAIGMGLATFLNKRKYTENERTAGLTSLIMGCMGLTEGAIPLAVPDPLRVIPSICIGGALGCAIVALFGCINYCPHGGLIVLPAITGKLGYLVGVAAGSLVTALLVNFLKKDVTEEAKEAE